ncbi:unnamed protein product [Trichobilharzia regenti]|nr:unnamed protein product [Trichobilharzia regenti]
MSINLLSLIFWCIFSNNFVNTVNTSKSAGLLQKHWLKDVDDDELRQMIEDANITEEQLNDPDQTSDIFQRLIFLSPKNLRRFMQVLREWDNLSQRIRMRCNMPTNEDMLYNRNSLSCVKCNDGQKESVLKFINKLMSKEYTYCPRFSTIFYLHRNQTTGYCDTYNGFATIQDLPN